jgi:hypothetical protein
MHFRWRLWMLLRSIRQVLSDFDIDLFRLDEPKSGKRPRWGHDFGNPTSPRRCPMASCSVWNRRNCEPFIDVPLPERGA